MQKVAIEVHDLTVSYDKKPVLWNIDFDILKGSFAGIIGPNGAGKSTLLKAMMGLIRPGAGYVKILDQQIDQIRSQLSYVPQRESVDWDFPATVMDVALMGRINKANIFRRYSKEDKRVASESLEKTGMLSYANRQIGQLSGGQQQRVFIARSLAQGADIYLMDEPFSGVDAATEASILQLLKTMSDEGKTILVVHHDLQSAYDYFDDIVLLNLRLIDAGRTEDVLTPENIQRAYGGQHTLLNRIGQLLRKQPISIEG